MALKTTFRIVKYAVLTLLLLPVVYLLMALLLSFIPSETNNSTAEKNQTIYINSNGVHLDIMIPNKQLSIHLKQQLTCTKNGFTSFGWGDKDFYLNTPEWKDLSVKTAFNALFCTSKTLTHIDRYSYKNNNWDSIKISENGLLRLNQYLEKSFAKDSLNNFIKIANAHYSKTDNFYKATGSYSCFKTCNTWINNALKEGSITGSLWTPFDFGVMYHVKNQ